jgi:hypothetical protein
VLEGRRAYQAPAHMRAGTPPVNRALWLTLGVRQRSV